MAKPGMPKKKRGPSINSRAMRRATSPGIDTDKSIKEITPPRTDRETLPSVLAARAGAGVSKRASTRKAVRTARAKKRHERGVEMAAAVSQRLGKKVEKSALQGKVVRGRGKAWEDVNTALAGAGAGQRAKVKGNLFAALGDGAGGEKEGDDEGNVTMEAAVPLAVLEADEDGDEGIL